MGKSIAYMRTNGDMITSPLKDMQKVDSKKLSITQDPQERFAGLGLGLFIGGVPLWMTLMLDMPYAVDMVAFPVSMALASYPLLAMKFGKFQTAIRDSLRVSVESKEMLPLYIKYITRRKGSISFNSSKIEDKKSVKIFEVDEGQLTLHDYMLTDPLADWEKTMDHCVKTYGLDVIKKQQAKEKVALLEMEYDEIVQQYKKGRIPNYQLPDTRLGRELRASYNLFTEQEMYDFIGDEDYFWEITMDGKAQTMTNSPSIANRIQKLASRIDHLSTVIEIQTEVAHTL